MPKTSISKRLQLEKKRKKLFQREKAAANPALKKKYRKEREEIERALHVHR
ncbi:MAG: hypothetical protein ACTSU5_01860 [Promethearchaeota archaeon]